jgi:ParB-like chromosome segregation protein Spo0J
MEFHEVASVFPPMGERDYQALRADIAQNGLKQPVILHEGKLVDGRHRYRACIELGIEPRLMEWDGEGSLVAFVVSMNLHRRHLTTSQRALLATELKPLFDTEARARQGTRTDLGADLREGDRGKASAQVAEMVGVSTRSVETASRIRQRAVPELMEAVRRGDLAVSMAALIADLTPQDQEKVISLKDKREMRKAAQEMRRAAKGVRAPGRKDEEGEIVAPVLRLLEQAASLVGDREPTRVAAEFFEQFPLNDQRMTERLEGGVAGAALLWEIYRIWEHRRAKAV